jgi:glycosyltransferase involved in cell wall biosynthesis
MSDITIVSIVTPSYNQGEFLAATIESVISQAGDFLIDYIIMDGGSTDTSVEIMQKYERLLQLGEWPISCKGITFRWRSEKDHGQADAVNMGFALAQGEILGWLNSDDTYLPGAAAKAVDFFRANPDSVMVYGNAWYTDRRGDITKRYASEPFNMKRIAEKCVICQPSVFIRSAALRSIGALDTGLHAAMDYDLWIRAGKRFPGKIYFIEEYLSTSRMYGENKTLLLRDHIHRETMAVVKKHFGHVPGTWIVHCFLEVLQAPALSFPEKMSKIFRSRMFVVRYLWHPLTLCSLVRFVYSRIKKPSSHEY